LEGGEWDGPVVVDGGDAEGVALGDEQDDPERKKALERTAKSLGWERWVEVFVSFKDKNGRFHLPQVTLPTIEDDEDVDEQMGGGE